MIWKKKTNVKNIQYNPHYKTALFADQKRSYTGGGLITEVRPHEELGIEVSQQVYNFIGDRIILFKKCTGLVNDSLFLSHKWVNLFVYDIIINFIWSYLYIDMMYLS